MNKPVKIIIFLVIGLIIALVGGQLIGAKLFQHFSKMPVPIRVSTLYDLYVVSKGQVLKQIPYIMGLIVSILIPLSVIVIFIAAAIPKSKRELHGSARFARLIDIRKAKLLEKEYSEPDILIGKYKGQYLRWGGKEFAYLAAPTRSGKGVSTVIPNCLHYRDSLVVFDPKLENFEITSGYRKHCGQEVYLFNPSTDAYRSHRWNPLHYVSRDPDFTPRDMAKIANILFSSSGSDDNAAFFQGMAQQLFIGLGLYLIETENETGITPTISGIKKLSQPTGVDLPTWIKQQVLRDDISEICKRNMLSYAATSANTASSILASMIEPLSVFDDPIVAEATSGNDFDFRDLRKKRMTIYLGISLNDIARFSRLNNLFFSQLLAENLEELPSQNPELKYQCLLLMDEFTSLGKMEVFEKGVAFIAGYNMRVLLIFQNMAQLNAAYTENGARSLSTNIACQIIFTPADVTDAKEFSEIIGYETYKAKSISRSQKSQGGRSVSTSDQQRAVLLPQELMQMPLSEAIINLRGVPKIQAEKIEYWSDPSFIKRLGYPPPDIPIMPKGIAKAKAKAIISLSEEEQDILKIVVQAMLPADAPVSRSYIESLRKQYQNIGGSHEIFSTFKKYL